MLQYLFSDVSTYKNQDILEVINSATEPYKILQKKYNTSSAQERLKNYSPEEEVLVSDLSEGDLIKLPSNLNYSMFISFSINGDGDNVVKYIDFKESLPREELLEATTIQTRK